MKWQNNTVLCLSMQQFDSIVVLDARKTITSSDLAFMGDFLYAAKLGLQTGACEET